MRCGDERAGEDEREGRNGNGGTSPPLELSSRRRPRHSQGYPLRGCGGPLGEQPRGCSPNAIGEMSVHFLVGCGVGIGGWLLLGACWGLGRRLRSRGVGVKDAGIGFVIAWYVVLESIPLILSRECSYQVLTHSSTPLQPGGTICPTRRLCPQRGPNWCLRACSRGCSAVREHCSWCSRSSDGLWVGGREGSPAPVHGCRVGTRNPALGEGGVGRWVGLSLTVMRRASALALLKRLTMRPRVAAGWSRSVRRPVR